MRNYYIVLCVARTDFSQYCSHFTAGNHYHLWLLIPEIDASLLAVEHVAGILGGFALSVDSNSEKEALERRAQVSEL